MAASRQEEDRGSSALHHAGRARRPARRDAVILRRRDVAPWRPVCHAYILPETRAMTALCVRALRAHRAASSGRRPLRIDALGDMARRMRQSQQRIRPKRFIVADEADGFHPLEFVGNQGGNLWSQDLRNIRDLRGASEA